MNMANADESRIRIEWLSNLAEIETIHDKWVALEKTVRDRTVYCRYDYIIPWYRCYAGTKLTEFGEPLLGLAREGSELIAIAPMISSKASFGKVPVRRADCAGYNLAAGEFLIQDGASGVIEKFVDSIVDGGNFDVICLNGIDVNSDEFAKMRGHVEGRGLKLDLLDYHSYALADLRQGYEGYNKSMSRNFRRQTGRIAKKINAAGKSRLERIVSSRGGDEDSAILARMFSLTESSWRTERAGIAEERKHQPFYRDLFTIFGQRGEIDLSILSINSQDAAFTLALTERGIYYQVLVAYAEKFKNLSPGSHLLQAVFKVLPQDGIHTVMSHGGYEYKKRWTTAIVPQSTVCIFGRGIRANLSYFLKFKIGRALIHKREQIRIV